MKFVYETGVTTSNQERVTKGGQRIFFARQIDDDHQAVPTGLFITSSSPRNLAFTVNAKTDELSGGEFTWEIKQIESDPQRVSERPMERSEYVEFLNELYILSSHS